MNCRIINKDFLILLLSFLVSIMPGVKYIGLVLQIVLFVNYYLKHQYENLALLLFTYSMYGSSLSIYSYKIIYTLILLLMVVKLPSLIHLKLNFWKIHVFICFVFYFFIYSFIKNFYSHTGAFISDYVCLTGLFIGYFLFWGIDKETLMKISIKLFVFYICANLIVIFFKYGYSESVDWFGNHKRLLMVGESFSLFLYIILYKLFFSKRNLFIKVGATLLFLFIAVKLQDFGSMVIIFTVLCFFVLAYLKIQISRHKIKIITTFVCFFMTCFFITSVIQASNIGEKYEMITFKFNNITNLFKNFSFSDREKIKLIPLSPYVRVVEIINITSCANPYTFLCGQGAGGAYTDSYFPFEDRNIGKILGPDDFPAEMRTSHIFTVAHNLGYPYLKFGLLWFIFIALWILIKIQRHKRNITVYNYYLAFVLYLAFSCYIGFTFQVSIAVSIILLTFHKNLVNKKVFINGA